MFCWYVLRDRCGADGEEVASRPSTVQHTSRRGSTAADELLPRPWLGAKAAAEGDWRKTVQQYGLAEAEALARG